MSADDRRTPDDVERSADGPERSQLEMGPDRRPPADRRGPSGRQSLYDRVVGELSLEQAVVVGLAAAVLVFGLTIAVTLAEPGSDDGGGTDVELEEDPGVVDAYGWLFFSTHFVEVEASITADSGQQASPTFDLVDQEADLPSIIYRLVPVLSLTMVGYLFARFSLEGQVRPSDGIRAGALLVAGYLPAVVAGLLLFAHQTGYQGGVVRYGVPFLPGLAIAGIAYPLVFGGLGGYLAHRTPDV